MASTKINAPRTLATLPRAWIVAITTSLRHDPVPARSRHGEGGSDRTTPWPRSVEFPSDDRKPLVFDSDPEPDLDPELGDCRARRVGVHPALRIRFDCSETPGREVGAD